MWGRLTARVMNGAGDVGCEKNSVESHCKCGTGRMNDDSDSVLYIQKVQQ
jgi:hypothetical protein